jgi:hypothetical protein
MSKVSQEKRILDHLLNGRSLTPIDALQQFGCFRLGARIYQLKKIGYNIESKTVETQSGKRVSLYYIPFGANTSTFVGRS